MIKILLRRSRPFNLLLVILLQYLLGYALIRHFGLPHAMNHLQFFMLVCSTVALAMGGNLLNDLLDVETDRINKSHKNAVLLGYPRVKLMQNVIVLFIVGIGLGMYLASELQHSKLGLVQFIASFLLVSYNSTLKNIPLLGNLTVAFLCALVALMVGLFDFLPIIDYSNQPTIMPTMTIITGYAIFAFIITLLRELVKDMEDVEGDKAAGIDTFPVHFGMKKAKILAFTVALLLQLLLLFYTITVFESSSLGVLLYIVLAVMLPLAIAMYKLVRAQDAKAYYNCCNWIKLVMLTGILSIGFFTLNSL